MNISEIKQKIDAGDLVLYNNKLYDRETWAAIQNAKKQEAHYDLLQLTKKIQLNSALT